MADLLAKQEAKKFSLSRNQEVEGEIVAILSQEIVLDLGAKSEGILNKKDLSPEQVANLKVGDKLITFVIQQEDESGQIVLALKRASNNKNTSPQFKKFENALNSNQTFTARGIEVNKGGLMVEVSGVRGFLPSSQVSLSNASNMDELVGKDLAVTVIEVDSSQNRLIFSQKTHLSEDTKQRLNNLKSGDEVSGEVAAVLPFGIFVTLNDSSLEGSTGVEGLVHISEISWDKVEDPKALFKIGDQVKAKVISTDANTGKVNLSIKQLIQDPFVKLASDFQPDDVVKGKVLKVNPQGVYVELQDGLEGFIPTIKMEADTDYQAGESVTCLVDSIDNPKRRINLVPFVTSTKDLIYK